MRPARRRALLAALVLVGLLPFVSPARAYVPSGATWTSATIHEADGTDLEAEVFRPTGLGPRDRTPVVLEVSPYLSNAVDTGHPLGWHRPAFLGWDLEQAGLFARGYTYVEVALRGYGASTGCGDLGGPDEQRDVVAAVEWAASQPWSTGRVGMWGMSYDGWTQVMALADHPRGLAAVIMMSPVVDPLLAVAMNGVRYDDLDGYAAAEYYQALAAQPPGPYAVADPPAPAFAEAATVPDPRCAAPDLIGTASTDPSTAFWRARDLTRRVQGTRVPALLGFGLLDQTVHPTQLLPLWQALHGPKELFVGQWDHVVTDPSSNPPGSGADPASVGRDAFMAQALRWLDRYVKGDQSVPVERDPRVTVEDGTGAWREEESWPTGRTLASFPLRPGTYQDVPGNDGENRGGTPYPGVTTPREQTGVGAWTVGSPLATPTLLSGVPVVSAQPTAVTPGAHLVALLYDVHPDGQATLVTRGVTTVSGPGRTSLALWPQDWQFAAGHRIGVLLTGADDDAFTPGTTGSTVTVSEASLSLPCAGSRGPALPGRPSRAVEEQAPITVPADALASSAPWSGCPAG